MILQFLSLKEIELISTPLESGLALQLILASRLQQKSQSASSEPRPQETLHSHFYSFSESYDHQENKPRLA